MKIDFRQDAADVFVGRFPIGFTERSTLNLAELIAASCL